MNPGPSGTICTCRSRVAMLTGRPSAIQVKGGGCSGFQYGLTWENERKENDEVMEFGGVQVFVDALSNMYLDTVTIDYIDGLDGSGFKIENPKASGTCGCGSSFSA